MRYSVYLNSSGRFIIRFGRGNVGTQAQTTIEKAFNAVRSGNVVLTTDQNRSNLTFLFSCNSLNDAKTHYPEYFI